MKEGQNLSYVTKMGAYGLAVAAAFAVALAVLLSVSTTSTAEAQTATASGADVKPGATVLVSVTEASGPVRFEIDSLSTSSASFTSSDEPSIVCNDNGSCDVKLDADDNEATDPVDVDATVTVSLKVDSDSADGFIIVKTTDLLNTPTPTVAYQSFNVKRGQVAGSISAKASTTTITAAGTDDATITVTVKDDSDDTVGIEGVKVSVTTTNGVIAGDTNNDGDVNATDTCVQACTLTTQEAGDGADQQADTDDDVAVGTLTFTLKGSGRAGSATVVVRAGDDLTDSVEITLAGAAKNLEAAAEQASVEIGGSVLVVLSVTDSGDNPVKGAKPIETAKDGIVGPDEDARTVKVAYNVAKDVTGTANDIPACGDKAAVDADSDAEPAIDAQDAVPGGTNAAGKCVVQVSAPPEDDDTPGDQAATRGVNTLSFRLSDAADADTASVAIEVAGTPSSLTTDASEYVEPLSETTITVTVFDDEDVRVGVTAINVRKLEGGGIVEGAATEAEAKTSNGQAKFDFIAPSTEGTVTFVIDAGSGTKAIRQTVSLKVGTAMEDVPVDPETPVVPDVETPVVPDVETPVMEDATLTGSGSIRFFSGGSVDDLSAAATAACPGGAIVWVQADDGTWPAPLSTTAPAFANAPFTAAFPDGFDGPTGVWVSSCDEGDMDNEGDMDEGDAG